MNPIPKFLKSIPAILFACICLDCFSQSQINAYDRYRQEIDKSFEQERQKIDDTFESFRDRINDEFSAFLEKHWTESSAREAEVKPLRPKPKPEPEPAPSVEESTPEPDRALPCAPADSDTTNVPADTTAPTPLEPIVERPYDPTKNDYVKFKYLGRECKVRAPVEKFFHIPSDCTNENIADAWRQLSSENFNDMLVDCLGIRKSMELCDWAFNSMLEAFTGAYYGNAKSADAAVTRAYVLTQFGYKVRLVRNASGLAVLLAFDDRIYSVPYHSINGTNFYDFSGNEGTVYVCDFNFPGEKAMSAGIKTLPLTGDKAGKAKEFHSVACPEAQARVAVNLCLQEFYDSYPQCDVGIMASAGLSEKVKKQLYPSLQKAIAGKSEEQAANVLLNFVQTAFDYQTDGEQFGREKTFFADELFHYPYCDCEDRSVLFSTLVRDLLGLDVILLDYPNHIATAVRFNTDVKGDYCEMDGNRYVVCDPTYIGASIGKSMSSMSNQVANAIRIR